MRLTDTTWSVIDLRWRILDLCILVNDYLNCVLFSRTVTTSTFILAYIFITSLITLCIIITFHVTIIRKYFHNFLIVLLDFGINESLGLKVHKVKYTSKYKNTFISMKEHKVF